MSEISCVIKNHDHGNDGNRQKKLDVIVGRGLHQQPAEAFVVEQGLDDDDARSAATGTCNMMTVNGAISALRSACLITMSRKLDTLQPRGTDVLRRHDLGHGGPCHPGDVAHAVKGDGA